MPVYEYAAINAKGKTRKGVVSADSPQLARRKLREEGLFPKSLKETSHLREPKESSRLFQAPRVFSGVSKRETAIFMRQLGNLLEAGFPLMKALSLIEEQTKSKPMLKVVSQLIEEVKSGAGFAAAMTARPDVFPATHVGLIKAAENTGALDAAVESLADLTERQMDLRRKITAAAAYPALMCVVGFAVILLLMGYVVPQLVQIFATLKQELPLSTVILISVSQAIHDYWPAGLAVLVLVLAGAVLFKRTDRGRRFFDRLKLSLPLFGALARGFAVARFTRTLGVVIRHGSPILAALTIVERVAGNVVFAGEIKEIHRKVSEGVSLTRALSDSPLFPGLVVQMVSAGERGGSLDEMLIKVSDMMESELTSRVVMLSSLFEPVMILCMGAAVGFIVLAVLLPIFELSTLIR